MSPDIEELVRELRDSRERLDSAIGRLPGNVNVVRLEGAGSIWNGIAIGIALGATIACAVWVGTSLTESSVAARQAEAYHKAVYTLAPRFAEEIDRELERQREETP